MDGFNPRREWPDKSLPQKQQPSTTTTIPSVQGDVVQSPLKVHHLHTDIFKSIGVGAFKEYEESRIENVLDRVTEGAKKCAVCGFQCHNTQKLRNHIKITHLVKTFHECSHCSKHLGDVTTLRIHRRECQPESAFDCKVCHKKYLSVRKLNRYRQSHEAGRFCCKFCMKEFKHARNLREHERIC